MKGTRTTTDSTNNDSLTHICEITSYFEPPLIMPSSDERLHPLLPLSHAERTCPEVLPLHCRHRLPPLSRIHHRFTSTPVLLLPPQRALPNTLPNNPHPCSDTLDNYCCGTQGLFQCLEFSSCEIQPGIGLCMGFLIVTWLSYLSFMVAVICWVVVQRRAGREWGEEYSQLRQGDRDRPEGRIG